MIMTNPLQLLRDFRKWRKERKRERLTKCDLCYYVDKPTYISFCCSCANGVDEDYFAPRLKPINDAVFRNLVIKHFLGTNWYVVDPLNREQVNAIALEEILKKVKI